MTFRSTGVGRLNQKNTLSRDGTRLRVNITQLEATTNSVESEGNVKDGISLMVN